MTLKSRNNILCAYGDDSWEELRKQREEDDRRRLDEEAEDRRRREQDEDDRGEHLFRGVPGVARLARATPPATAGSRSSSGRR